MRSQSGALKTLSRIESLNSSVNGSPRFRLGFDDGTSAITSSDYGFCYEIGNPGMRIGDTVRISTTAAGRVCDMWRADTRAADRMDVA